MFEGHSKTGRSVVSSAPEVPQAALALARREQKVLLWAGRISKLRDPK